MGRGCPGWVRGCPSWGRGCPGFSPRPRRGLRADPAGMRSSRAGTSGAAGRLPEWPGGGTRPVRSVCRSVGLSVGLSGRAGAGAAPAGPATPPGRPPPAAPPGPLRGRSCRNFPARRLHPGAVGLRGEAAPAPGTAGTVGLERYGEQRPGGSGRGVKGGTAEGTGQGGCVGTQRGCRGLGVSGVPGVAVRRGCFGVRGARGVRGACPGVPWVRWGRRVGDGRTRPGLSGVCPQE